MLSGSQRVSRSEASRLFAFLTVQQRAEMALTPVIGQDPWTIKERWVMSNMLSMTTGQIGNPVAMLVLMITDDRLLHVVRSLTVRS